MLWRLQEYSVFVFENIRSIGSVWRYRRDTLEQMYIIGAQAFLIASLSGLFMGIIMSIETGHRLETFGAKLLVGRTTSLALFRELGPVITGLPWERGCSRFCPPPGGTRLFPMNTTVASA